MTNKARWWGQHRCVATVTWAMMGLPVMPTHRLRFQHLRLPALRHGFHTRQCGNAISRNCPGERWFCRIAVTMGNVTTGWRSACPSAPRAWPTSTPFFAPADRFSPVVGTVPGSPVAGSAGYSIIGIPLEENLFWFEPEITSKVARLGCRIYEVGITSSGQTYAEWKKINRRDGVRTLWCILKYR